MPILIRHDKFDERLESLSEKQPVRVSKTALLEAMIESSLEACERSGNPEAWREIGNTASASVAGAQQNTSGHRRSGDDQISSPAAVATNVNGSRSSSDSPLSEVVPTQRDGNRKAKGTQANTTG